jgi:nitrate/nitrite-specific signal transduction histidine kinase
MIDLVQELRVAASALPGPPGDFVISGYPQADDRYAAAVQNVRERIADYEAVHRQHRHSTAHATSARMLMEAVIADVDRMEQVGSELFSSSAADEQSAKLRTLDTTFAAMMSSLDQLLGNAEEDVASAKAERLLAERRAFLGLGSSALLSVIFAVGLASILSRSISKPLARLAAAAERIAGGELSTPITVDGPGEIARLAEVLDEMRLALLRERGQLRLLAVLEERDRIGREMHDGLAQVLGYVNTKAQAVREFLRAGESDQAQHHIQELVGAAREAYTDAREAIDGLRIADIAQRDLSDLLRETTNSFARRSQVATSLTVVDGWDDEAISSTVRVQILRIVQEALTNIRKHAGAGKATVTLAVADGQAHIRITDDGAGFPLSRLLQPDYDHYGLRTMRERTHAIAGTFRIESVPGSGTSIIVCVPLQAATKDRQQ